MKHHVPEYFSGYCIASMKCLNKHVQNIHIYVHIHLKSRSAMKRDFWSSFKAKKIKNSKSNSKRDFSQSTVADLIKQFAPRQILFVLCVWSLSKRTSGWRLAAHPSCREMTRAPDDRLEMYRIKESPQHHLNTRTHIPTHTHNTSPRFLFKTSDYILLVNFLKLLKRRWYGVCAVSKSHTANHQQVYFPQYSPTRCFL